MLSLLSYLALLFIVGANGQCRELLLNDFTASEMGGYNQLGKDFGTRGTFSSFRIVNEELHVVGDGGENDYWVTEFDPLCLPHQDMVFLQFSVSAPAGSQLVIDLEVGDGPDGCGNAKFAYPGLSLEMFNTPDGTMQTVVIPLEAFNRKATDTTKDIDYRNGLHLVLFSLANPGIEYIFDNVKLTTCGERTWPNGQFTPQRSTTAPTSATIAPPSTIPSFSSRSPGSTLPASPASSPPSTDPASAASSSPRSTSPTSTASTNSASPSGVAPMRPITNGTTISPSDPLSTPNASLASDQSPDAPLESVNAATANGVFYFGLLLIAFVAVAHDIL